MTKVSELLIQAKSLIDTPEKWTQKVFARNDSGEEVSFLDDDAVCFCSAGAIKRAEVELVPNSDDLWEVEVKAKGFLNRASRLIGGYSIIYFNDRRSTTHAQVMQVWDLAIQLTKEAEQ